MKGKFTSLKKLLCYVIISLFMFGIGGELVKADYIRVQSVQFNSDYNPSIWNNSTAIYAKFNVSYNGGGIRYAYCFDAPWTAPSPGLELTTYNSGIPEDMKVRMINVLLESGYIDDSGVLRYDLHYWDNPDNAKLTDEEAFYVTQAALWYVRYGAGGTTSVFTYNFHQKLYNGTYGLGQYSAIYRRLIDAANKKKNYNGNFEQTKVNIKSTQGNTMTETTINGNIVLVSDSIFSIDKSNGYSVQVTGENASIYGVTESGELDENYGTSKEFGPDEQFRIVIDVDDTAPASEHTATFTVNETLPSTFKYDIAIFYGISPNANNLQKLFFLTHESITPEAASFSVKGSTPDREFDVPYAKVDNDGNYLGGAWLAVYSTDGMLMDYWSTSSDGPRTIKLTEGDYYIKEVLNPDGYDVNYDPIEFHVDNTGKLTSGGQEVDVVRVSDDEAYFSVKKLFSAGMTEEQVAGVTLLIHPNDTDFTTYICGKTDSNGYLTVTDTEHCNNLGGQYSSATNKLNSTGVYSFKDFFYAKNPLNHITSVVVKEIAVPEGFLIDNNEYIIYGPSRGTIGGYAGDNGPAGDVNQIIYDGKKVVEYQFRNNRYIDVSKIDAATGRELAGATLTICRRDTESPTGECIKGPDGNSVYSDYWVSTDEPHKFVGIEKGVMYTLSETSSPKAYVKFEGKLDFKLLDDGKSVQMYNHETGLEIGSPVELTAVMPNTAIPTYISKTSAVTGEEIAGANLKICTEESYNFALEETGNGNNCTAIVEWVSEAGTGKQVDALEKGNYYLVETIAPVGYKMTNSVMFTVKDDGSINQIEFKNEPIKVLISKKDQATGKRLAGAKFEILNASDRSIAKDYNGNELVWESKADEDWLIVGMPAGEYILVETQKPEGFQDGMIIDGELVNEYKFTVSNEVSELEIDAYIEVMNAPNTGISTLNLFAIGGLMVFAGYETIKIYRRKALND